MTMTVKTSGEKMAIFPVVEYSGLYIQNPAVVAAHRLVIALLDSGRKWLPLESTKIYITFYYSNNNVQRFLQLFNIILLFIKTFNYKPGPYLIPRGIKTIRK